MLLISIVQGGFGTNFMHLLSECARHAAGIVEACVEQGIVGIEPEEPAEEEWLSVLHKIGFGNARYFAACAPSFYNSEQSAIDMRMARNLTYTGSLINYIAYLDRCRIPTSPGPGSSGRAEGSSTCTQLVEPANQVTSAPGLAAGGRHSGPSGHLTGGPSGFDGGSSE